MNGFRRSIGCAVSVILWAVAGAVPARPAEFPGESFRPFLDGETLIYRLLWPSGLTLGEAVFRVSLKGKELHFDATVEARLPQFTIRDSFSSVATQEGLCSLQFRQKTAEGTRQSEETIDFDQQAHQARRSRGGQITTSPIPECARDPLTFIYSVRSQLASGKPAGGITHWGKDIAVRLQPVGRESVPAGGRSQPAEKFLVLYSNPEKKLELWLATDAVRTPLRVTVPTNLAEFTAELP